MKHPQIFLTCILTILFVSCRTEKEAFVEPQKDLNGTWRITKVTRNATDITEWIDSTGFRLMLNNDNTYGVGTNNLPFLINSTGTWAADDPQYPYHLLFFPGDGTDSVSGNVGTPVIKGSRSLNFTFSPGCDKNTYIYTLEKMQ